MSGGDSSSPAVRRPHSDASTLDHAVSPELPSCEGAACVPTRLKKRAQFLLVASKGRKVPMNGLVLQALKRSDPGPARIGFTVTKKVGNAVIRNRTRRRLKEAARLWLRDHGVTGADLVLIGRDSTRGRPFDALQRDLARALEKAGVS
ncbi:MAG: ribonuclease P protein component [Rhodospirillales bacterium]|mgnify:CR=1 FL=1|nr:ribonuclease P protein component [Rhodospirillales bacterium]